MAADWTCGGLKGRLKRTMYDVVIIGGGHAGTEAAAAAARIGAHVALITRERSALARLSCNPAMGGTAKGQLIREIDALGGLMARATDLAAIQYRMLNRSKGPAVWSPRAQVDRESYTRALDRLFAERYPQVEILEDEAVGLEVSGSRLRGVVCAGRGLVPARAAVLCAGTFLRGLCHIGGKSWTSGRYTEPAAESLSESLSALGFPLRRFKTGTPPRVVAETVDLSTLQRQDSDPDRWFFSHETTRRHQRQLPCYRTHTTPATHEVIRGDIHLSPMFNGTIHAVGPRYCPSVEDKVVRFPDRDHHPLIFEPEGIGHPWLYLNGFSSSLPEETQLAALRTLPGCGEAEIGRPGYAVEYDVVPPHEIRPTLETRRVEGLYFAGQVNGTSGYEEAGIQGLLAGANAALRLFGRDPLLIERHEGYAGVLVDDLITLDPEEPYRMFTSRAEYRLLLRQDNAEDRLGEKAYAAGLISAERIEAIRARRTEVKRWVDRLHQVRLPRREVLDHDAEPDRVETAAHFLTRPGIRLEKLVKRLDGRLSGGLPTGRDVLHAAEIEVRYAGYFRRQEREIERLRAQESRPIPEEFDYSRVGNLSAEARFRLEKHRPATLGQASRLAGVTPSDLAILLVYLKRGELSSAAEKGEEGVSSRAPANAGAGGRKVETLEGPAR